MTKAELIEHIERIVGDDEQVVAIVVSQADLVDIPSDVHKWEAFAEAADAGWVQATGKSRDLIESAYEEFVEHNYQD